jgi:hypothetical protein
MAGTFHYKSRAGTSRCPYEGTWQDLSFPTTFVGYALGTIRHHSQPYCNILSSNGPLTYPNIIIALPYFRLGTRHSE